MKNRMKLAIGTALAAASMLASAQDAALQVRSWAASCAACHGTQGVAVEGATSLAGLRKEDLQKTMMDYKTGKKPATIMHQLAKGYSDAQIEQISGYFAALKK